MAVMLPPKGRRAGGGNFGWAKWIPTIQGGQWMAAGLQFNPGDQIQDPGNVLVLGGSG